MSHIEQNIGNHNFKFHEVLHQNLMKLRKANRNDWDFKILVSGDGMTRTGKTTIASQIALVLDETTDLNRVIFRGNKLIERSLEAGKNKAIIYDEAKEGLDSKKAMNSYSQKLTDYFSECGWLNQFLIVVLPEFFDLNKTVALNQSICLINCYARDGFNRGYFGFYNRKDKRYLYIKGKKYNNYQCQSPSFDGTFTKYFPFDLDEYNKLKIDNQRTNEIEDVKPKHTQLSKKYSVYLQKLQSHLSEHQGWTQRKFAGVSGMTKSSVSRLGEKEIE